MKTNLTNEEIESICKMDSDMLCAFIITYRTVKAMRDESKIAMVELMKRKSLGDEFDFDSVIQQGIQDTKLSINLRDKFNETKRTTIDSLVKNIFMGNASAYSDESDDEEKSVEQPELDDKTARDIEDMLEILKI